MNRVASDIFKCWKYSLKKQPTFCDATTGFPVKWRLSNEHKNSILMMCHYPDLDSASDWPKQIFHAARPIRSTPQICLMMCHQYGIPVLVSHMSFCAETNGGVAKCRQFSQANENNNTVISFNNLYFLHKHHLIFTVE